ncbi:hypothetical protein shim_12760 [Shimia sp. SK013]|uniref:hypothetical protein n=1 Tax=Shimia sp. SK013 TaxID=1389006 RepID=UPI0006CCBE66|nr:hypothetical protein [Shimia sp. SK013]KPA22983.1 hypothetical protein shim_12760 [Shimia sp. SK013]
MLNAILATLGHATQIVDGFAPKKNIGAKLTGARITTIQIRTQSGKRWKLPQIWPTICRSCSDAIPELTID